MAGPDPGQVTFYPYRLKWTRSMALRIPFDSVTLAALIAEIQPLVGGRIQKIVQPDPTSLVLAIYKGSEFPLLVNVDPQFFRIHLLTRRPQGLPDPPTFCMALRKAILNGRLVSVTQRGLDRIVDFVFSTAEGDFTLVVELMGTHSNAILVGPDGKILAAAKMVPESKSSRPILPHRPYLPPPLPPRPSFLTATVDDRLQDFEGVSPFLRKLIDAGTPLSQIQSSVETRDFGAFYSHGHGAYPFDPSPLGIEAVSRPSLSQALEQHFAAYQEESRVEHARNGLLAQLKRVLLAREVALASLQEAIDAAEVAPEHQRTAELILAYQGQIKPGDISLQAWDYEGNEVQIALDPELTPVENANKLFERARHAKDRHQEVRDQLARIKSTVPELQSAVTQLESATTLDEVEEVRALADSKNWLFKQPVSSKKQDRPYEGFPIRELEGPGGWKILYGTNATSNDYLTTRVAKPNDWWLHVRGQTSAHVVIQTGNKPDKVQRDDLEFAAKVCVRNSVAKNGSYVPVDYTLKKYVRKPRGSAPGLAVYEREKTLHIDP